MSSPFNPLTPSLGLPGPSGNTPYLNLGISPSGQSPSTSPWFQLGGANPLSQLGFSTPGNAGATPSGLASLGLGFSGIPGLNVPGSTGSGVGSNVGGGVGIGPGVGLGVGGGGGGVGGMGGMGMGQGQGQVGLLAPPTHTVPTGTDLDDAVRVLPEVMRRLERAEQLRSECAALEGRVFREGSEGGNERIEGVQLECECFITGLGSGLCFGRFCSERVRAERMGAERVGRVWSGLAR